MLKVILLRGLPASGKSTWAKEQLAKYPGRYKLVSKDSLRAMLDNSKWSKSNEKFVLKTRDALILLALQEGYHVLVDDTNLFPKHEETIRELVKGQAQVEIKDFTDVPLETCLERDRHRQNYVGEDVIRKMYRDFLQPKPPVIAYNDALPDAIICDLDGTLALISGRNPYDAARCEEDLVNEPVAGIVRNFASAGFTILFTSGRSTEHRTQTERWLHAHNFCEPYGVFFLLMRMEGDGRKDAVVKRELYEQHIEGKYNIKFVLDDRVHVVELWRELGLTCLQVAEGDY